MGHRRPGLSVKLWLAFTMLMAYCNYAFVFSECLNVHLFPVSALLQTQGSVGNIKFLLLCPVFLPSTFYFPSALCLHFFHLRPAPLTTSLIFLPLWKSLGAAVGIYTACVALVHTFCSSGGMFFSLGPKPMASPATLKQNTAEAGESGGRGDTAAMALFYFGPWPPHDSPPAPVSLGIHGDKDWTSPDATLHKCLIIGKTLASVIKAVI